MARLTRFILPIAFAVFAIDQLSKWWVTEALALGPINRDYPVLPPWLQFRYAENCGINFGIFSDCSDGARWTLVALSVVISAAIIFWALRRGTVSLAVGAGLITGGAIANAWDRVTHGAVIDFLNNSCCGMHNPFSYNIADVGIFAGAIWIAIRA